MSKRDLISVVVVLVFVVLALGSVPTDDVVETEVQSSPSTEVIRISASALMDAYDANKVAADAEYEGNILEVTGTIDEIGKDITDSMYVTLETGEMMFFVQCFFADARQDELSGLGKGQNVTVRGKCDGAMGNIFLRGCVLAD